MRWKYSRFVPTKETPKQKVSNLYSGRGLWWKKLGPDSRETNLGDDSFSHFSDSLFGLSWMTCLSVGRVGWSQKFAFLLRRTTTRATNLMSKNINSVKEECALELDEAGKQVGMKGIWVDRLDGCSLEGEILRKSHLGFVHPKSDSPKTSWRYETPCTAAGNVIN